MASILWFLYIKLRVLATLNACALWTNVNNFLLHLCALTRSIPITITINLVWLTLLKSGQILTAPEAIVIKAISPQRRVLRRDCEGAEPLLNHLAAFALVLNIYFPPTPCFVHRVCNKPPVFRERTLVPSFVNLLFWAAAHSTCQIEQGFIIFFVTTGPGPSYSFVIKELKPCLCLYCRCNRYWIQNTAGH